jgi:hypothetical protein
VAPELEDETLQLVLFLHFTLLRGEQYKRNERGGNDELQDLYARIAICFSTKTKRLEMNACDGQLDLAWPQLAVQNIP